MAPLLSEIVARLRARGELDIGEDTAAKFCSMSAATIDRRLAGERKRLELKGRLGTKPGMLLKSNIPIRTWVDWDEQQPGFFEIDCVGHEGGDPSGDFCQTHPAMLTDLVATLRRHGELDIDDEVAAQLTAMSAATIDRRLAGDRA